MMDHVHLQEDTAGPATARRLEVRLTFYLDIKTVF
jgi:hypothetical protein